MLEILAWVEGVRATGEKTAREPLESLTFTVEMLVISDSLDRVAHVAGHVPCAM